MPPRIGRMRERVTIQKKQFTADTGGGQAVTWIDVATVWAEVLQTRGREQFRADQNQPIVSHVVNIHWRPDVSEDNRLVWRGTPLNIHSVLNPDQKRQFLEIECESGVAS